MLLVQQEVLASEVPIYQQVLQADTQRALYAKQLLELEEQFHVQDTLAEGEGEGEGEGVLGGAQWTEEDWERSLARYVTIGKQWEGRIVEKPKCAASSQDWGSRWRSKRRGRSSCRADGACGELRERERGRVSIICGIVIHGFLCIYVVLFWGTECHWPPLFLWVRRLHHAYISVMLPNVLFTGTLTSTLFL